MSNALSFYLLGLTCNTLALILFWAAARTEGWTAFNIGGVVANLIIIAWHLNSIFKK